MSKSVRILDPGMGFAEIEHSRSLAEILTLAGLEVDSIEDAGPALDNKRIVVLDKLSR